ncbi:stress responsive protein [Orenia metallireducens]|jgi:hypothetical protein|uniref:Stress responsive protein n=1 Tax=Orenia metallireducens TaxID=1413210 RepID=A0A1C0A8S7_9FIRM|nr:Dabb family protein [Orenia metallireducens]OCL26642.1 stress responsive protein [Orenia metallireducens]
MIKHIVMWKMREEAEGANKKANIEKMKSMLEALEDKIEEIQAFEVGVNYNDSEAAYDLLLYSEFEDKDALARYQVHPDHVKVAEFVRKVAKDRAVVDYEL